MLQVGIVGLPNAGKSTLFNALLKKEKAYVAEFPFATIEPNVGVVPLEDERLGSIARAFGDSLDISPPDKVAATVKFMDIAGLISGAHKGEGLGNKFLSHIREAQAILHVLRMFDAPDVAREGAGDPKGDFEEVETELMLADLQTLEKKKEPKGVTDKDVLREWELVVKLKTALEEGRPVRLMPLEEDERDLVASFNLLTAKPILVALNVGEGELDIASRLEKEVSFDLGIGENQVVVICAKLESQLGELSPEEQKEYLFGLGVEELGLSRLIKKAFSTLGLITFFSVNEKEAHAWTVKDKILALDAAGVVHSDFRDNFVQAEVISWADFVKFGGWRGAREKGRTRSEGRDYKVKDGDVIHFKAAVAGF